MRSSQHGIDRRRGTPKLERRGHLSRALVGLALFVLWTVVVRIGIAEGSRLTVWSAQPFGTWPASIAALDGSNSMTLSIHARFASGGTLGWTTAGTATDHGDPNDMNGSRFTTGTEAGPVTSMSVHVGAPVDSPPHDQFQLAVYADRQGSPGTLLAASSVGTLVADAWNTVPISVTLAPHTPYWLLYNTNGSSDTLNNLTLTPVVGNPLDSVVRRRSARLAGAVDALAEIVRIAGHPLVTVLALLAVASRLGPDWRRQATTLGVGLLVATALEAALKHTLFAPYGAYPSGHAMRATFLATIVVAVSRRRFINVGIVALALLACLGTVRTRRHYAEEAVGGALAGWTLAAASLTTAAGMGRRRERGLPIAAAPDRRTPRDRRRGERRGREATYNPAT